MNLVIVESPTKAKTISRFLGPDYKVESSYGHIRDLPKSELGIDIEHNFEPTYVIPLKARAVIKKLKAAAQDSQTLILATDEDREGEAIAWHLIKVLGFDEVKNQSAGWRTKIKTIKRIAFHEITKSAIENALKNPHQLNFDLVNAQQARRVLDRLVGYKLSPFLWKKVARGLSAGRVQSVVVRLIVEREKEIRNFKPQEYWTIQALLESKSKNFKATLVKIEDKILKKFDIKNKEQAEKIANDLKDQEFKVLKIEEKELNKNPLPPFITSTLQQEAAKRLGFSSKKTMFIAQRLYENGFITYMRTDSVNLSQESLIAARNWLQKNLGDSYSQAAPKIYKSKSRLAQEAHEAIRPTDVSLTADNLEIKDKTDKNLYQLIWQRFIASQMPAAKMAVRVVEVEAEKYILQASGQQIIFDGFLKIYPQTISERELPRVERGEKLKLLEIMPSLHSTEPPPPYNEASLIKTLEKYGIGRPSTYAPIISVIQERNYVKKQNGRLYPTEIGELVTEVLTEHFPKIIDIGFTAEMEEDLDRIAEGKEKWQSATAKFYKPFAQQLETKYKEVSKKELTEEKTDEVCEKCGKPMIVKFSRFGKFLACSGFPDCKNTKSLHQEQKEEPKKTGLPCPKCSQGEIVERRVGKGRAQGKIFWGCSKYPKCDYASWEDPTKQQEESEK